MLEGFGVRSRGAASTHQPSESLNWPALNKPDARLSQPVIRPPFSRHMISALPSPLEDTRIVSSTLITIQVAIRRKDLLHVSDAHPAVEDADSPTLCTAWGSDNTSIGERQSLGTGVPLILPKSQGTSRLVLDQHITPAVSGPVCQLDHRNSELVTILVNFRGSCIHFQASNFETWRKR